jgi:hypothetical protein
VTFSDSPHKVTYRNRGANTELVAEAANTAAPGIAAGLDVPLGQSPVTNGTGQSAGAAHVPPVIDTAVGGNDEVTVAGTEAASAGTDGIVTYTVYRTADDVATAVVTEDADADVTITGLEHATNYYVVGYAQTEVAAASGGSRVGPASPREYFTTT